MQSIMNAKQILQLHVYKAVDSAKLPHPAIHHIGSKWRPLAVFNKLEIGRARQFQQKSEPWAPFLKMTNEVSHGRGRSPIHQHHRFS